MKPMHTIPNIHANFRLPSLDDAFSLLEFERSNRAWFESQIEPRAADFYSISGVENHIMDLLSEHKDNRMHPCLILNQDGEILGRANLKSISQRDACAEVGYRIGQDYLGRGLATAALRYLIALASTEWQLNRLHAYVAENNAASLHVLEKAGFVKDQSIANLAKINQQIVNGHRLTLDLF